MNLRFSDKNFVSLGKRCKYVYLNYRGLSSRLQSPSLTPFNRELKEHSFVVFGRGLSKSNGKMAEKTMIIDCDCGVDDALALLLALKSNWTTLAITSCMGNTSAEKAAFNVVRTLNLCNRQNIPVYLGSIKPLVDLGKHFDHTYHADDGFGGVADQYPIGDQKLEDGHASLALCRYARERPKEITLVALGPLTNLALSKRLDPDFDSNLKELVVMGGNVDGVGNASPTAEFNFYVDPEAAYTVLREFKCPITILPWETCLRVKLPYPWLDAWLNHDNPVANLIQKIIAGSVKISKVRTDDPVQGVHVPDLLAMAALLYPELVKEEILNPAWVELSGLNTRGMMVVDKRGLHKRAVHLGTKTIVRDMHLKPLLDLLETLTKKDWTN